MWNSTSRAKAAREAPGTLADILRFDQELRRAHARATWARHHAAELTAADKTTLSDRLLADIKRAARAAHACRQQKTPDALSSELRAKFTAVRVNEGGTWADVGRSYESLALYLVDQLSVVRPGWINGDWVRRKIRDGFRVPWVDTTPTTIRAGAGKRVPGSPTQ